MDIHHAMIVRSRPERLFEALTRRRDLQVWMGALALAGLEVGSAVELQFDQGQRTLKMEVIRLKPGRQVQWRVTQPVWPAVAVDQIIT